MNKKYLLSTTLVFLAVIGSYFYYFKPHGLAVAYCENDYKYYPATAEQGAYHTATGFSGPITKFETREDAISMCAKNHIDTFRAWGNFMSQ